MHQVGRGQETSAGGSRREFPQTHWSLFLQRAESGAPADEPSMRELARRYWKPIYLYVRASWAKSNDDAKDLTQDFFVWMMEGEFLRKADPSRGRFRAYLKVALKHYLASDHERRERFKRGGGRAFVPLEAISPEEDLPDPAGGDPERELDRAWRNETFSRAAERLESALRDEGKEIVFRVFREFHRPGEEEPAHREVAARLSIPESEVTNHLRAARRRLQNIVTDLVAETVRGEAELREELRSLFGTP